MLDGVRDLELVNSGLILNRIAGASRASTKPLSLLLGRVLTFLKNHFENYCAALKNNQGSSVYWSVDNQLETLNMLNDVTKFKHLVTADFGTLYTKLPLEVVQENLRFIVDLLFKNSGKTYLVIGYKRTYYSSEEVRNTSAYGGKKCWSL